MIYDGNSLRSSQRAASGISSELKEREDSLCCERFVLIRQLISTSSRNSVRDPWPRVVSGADLDLFIYMRLFWRAASECKQRSLCRRGQTTVVLRILTDRFRYKDQGWRIGIGYERQFHQSRRSLRAPFARYQLTLGLQTSSIHTEGLPTIGLHVWFYISCSVIHKLFWNFTNLLIIMVLKSVCENLSTWHKMMVL